MGTMELVLLTLAGSVLGGLGGGISSGGDGLLLGGSIGFVVGATIWTFASMAVQWQHERRLDRYFNETKRYE